jgi:hypothetical protein
MDWDYFDKIVCINLPSRTDRRDQAQAEFDRVGVAAEFIPAQSHVDGRIGLQRTLHDVLAENYSARNILIFEDDVMFVGDGVDKLRLALDDLHHIFHDAFDMLYFGANLTEPCLNVTDNLILLHGALACHAVCYNHRIFDRYIRQLKRVSDQGFIATDWDISDVWLTRVQAHGRSYMVSPRIAVQRPGYSDIEKRIVDYTGIL